MLTNHNRLLKIVYPSTMILTVKNLRQNLAMEWKHEKIDMIMQCPGQPVTTMFVVLGLGPVE